MRQTSELSNKITKLLPEYLGYGIEKKIHLNAKLREDLGADSLDLVEIAMFLEEEFSVEISDDEINHVETVQNLISLVESKL